jgi:hypothetical protein
MPISDDELGEEFDLKVAVMRADLGLKRQQGFWETPRNIAILLTGAAAIAGLVGFELGQKEPVTQPPPPPQIIFQPGSIQVLPAPAPVTAK